MGLSPYASRGFATRARWRSGHFRETTAGLTLKSLGILPNSVHMAECVSDSPLNRGDYRFVGRCQPVMNPQAVATSGDKSSTPKVRQVPRRLRLGNPETLMNMADAHFSRRQQTENA
jgi:hypothetical protein